MPYTYPSNTLDYQSTNNIAKSAIIGATIAATAEATLSSDIAYETATYIANSPLFFITATIIYGTKMYFYPNESIFPPLDDFFIPPDNFANNQVQADLYHTLDLHSPLIIAGNLQYPAEAG